MDISYAPSASASVAHESVVPYVGDQPVAEYLKYMSRHHPHFVDAIDVRLDSLRAAQAWRGASEFDDNHGTGRGDSYRRAQRSDAVREVGVLRLLDLVTPQRGLDSTLRVLDVLGGDGLVARVWQRVSGHAGPMPILTGDSSPQMTRACIDYGLPAICQPAQRLLVRDDVLDSVLLAYGTHHIPRQDRPAVVAEAYRVLKSGGRLVLHDFDENSSVARWFADVVDRYSPAGHRYEHFTPGEMEGYFVGAGFADVRLVRMYDPVLATGDDPDDALDQLVRFVVDMYGLRLLGQGRDERAAKVELLELLRRCFLLDPLELPTDAGPDSVAEVTVRRQGGGYVAVLPRVALVAVGTKP
jgi:SAM-dependent methyltransferase